MDFLFSSSQDFHVYHVLVLEKPDTSSVSIGVSGVNTIIGQGTKNVTSFGVANTGLGDNDNSGRVEACQITDITSKGGFHGPLAILDQNIHFGGYIGFKRLTFLGKTLLKVIQFHPTWCRSSLCTWIPGIRVMACSNRLNYICLVNALSVKLLLL